MLIVKLRQSETRVEQTAPSRSDEFLTIAEMNGELSLSLGEELGWHIKRTATKLRDKLRKRPVRVAIQ